MNFFNKLFLLILLILALCACEKKTLPSNSEVLDTLPVDNGTTTNPLEPSNEYCATAVAPGCIDNVKVTVCVDSQGKIQKVTSENHETAGLGTKAIQEMAEAMMQQDNEFVDAISGATVSSNAFYRAAGEAYMVAYAKSQGMICSDPDNPVVGIWRWDSNDTDFEKTFWLIYPDGLFVPYSVEQNEYMISLRDAHQDQREVSYQDSTLYLIRDNVPVDSLPINWIDQDHLSLPGTDELYYSASRMQIDDDILVDEVFTTTENSDTASSLTLQKLCGSVWANNGYRFSDTTICKFNMDGTAEITYPVSMPVEYSGTFELRNDSVTITWESNSLILAYNKEKNILINMDSSVTHIVEQDHGDSEGNYVPAKMAREIFEPYSAVPYLDSSSQAQKLSTIPEKFTESHIKETVRPYLKALSYLSIPQKYCEVSWDDTFMDENGMTYSLVTNYGSVEEAMAAVASYVTDDFLKANFQSDAFRMRNGKLYLMESTMGWSSWDANSVKFSSLIGEDEIAVNVDLYNSGGTYLETKTIYFQDINGEYVVSGISWLNTERASSTDISPQYDPI